MEKTESKPSAIAPTSSSRLDSKSFLKPQPKLAQLSVHSSMALSLLRSLLRVTLVTQRALKVLNKSSYEQLSSPDQKAYLELVTQCFEKVQTSKEQLCSVTVAVQQRELRQVLEQLYQEFSSKACICIPETKEPCDIIQLSLTLNLELTFKQSFLDTNWPGLLIVDTKSLGRVYSKIRDTLEMSSLSQEPRQCSNWFLYPVHRAGGELSTYLTHDLEFAQRALIQRDESTGKQVLALEAVPLFLSAFDYTHSSLWREHPLERRKWSTCRNRGSNPSSDLKLKATTLTEAAHHYSHIASQLFNEKLYCFSLSIDKTQEARLKEKWPGKSYEQILKAVFTKIRNAIKKEPFKEMTLESEALETVCNTLQKQASRGSNAIEIKHFPRGSHSLVRFRVGLEITASKKLDGQECAFLIAAPESLFNIALHLLDTKLGVKIAEQQAVPIDCYLFDFYSGSLCSSSYRLGKSHELLYEVSHVPVTEEDTLTFHIVATPSVYRQEEKRLSYYWLNREEEQRLRAKSEDTQ